jgi:hypothetical protein
MGNRGPKKGAKNAGRPATVIDYEKVELLATLQATDTEIAAALDIPQSTFSTIKGKDPKLFDTIKKGAERGKLSVRRAQYKKAMQGNPTMLIWWGKQNLDQKDKREDTIEHRITVADLPNMSDEDLITNLKKLQGDSKHATRH